MCHYENVPGEVRVGGVLVLKKTGVRVAIAVAVFIAVGLGAGGYLVLTHLRGQGAYKRAEEAFAENAWRDAKTNYGWYMARHPEDREVLPKYIEASLNLIEDRPSQLRDAGRAYIKLAQGNSVEEAHKMADFYRQHQLWHELKYAAELLLREHPQDVYLTFCRALASQRLGNLTAAMEGYQAVLAMENAPVETYGNLAVLYSEQGLGERARQFMSDAVDAHPNDPEILVERARFRLEDGDTAGAVEDIEAALAAGAESPEALLSAARVRMATRAWEEGRKLAERATARGRDGPEAHLLIANAYLAEDRVEPAIDYLAGLDPYTLADTPQRYAILAELQIDRGRLEDARETIETLRRAYPASRPTRDYLNARILLKEERFPEAVAKLEVLVEQAPDIQAARYYLSLAYLRNGQQALAKNALSVYLKSRPADNRAQWLWNNNFANRSPQALAEEGRALLANNAPYLPSLLYTGQALCNRQNGVNEEQRALGINLLERAIETAPNNPEPYRSLGFALLQENDFEAVRNVLARAEAADIAPDALVLLQAGLGLAENDTEKAWSLFEQELASSSMTPQAVEPWASLFTDLADVEDGLEVLDKARAAATEPGNLQALDLARIALCRRTGQIEQACALLEDFDADRSQDATLLSRMNEERLEVARALLQLDEPPQREKAMQLITQVEESEPGRSDVMILRAQLLLQQPAPDLASAERLCADARDAGADDAQTLLVSSDVAYRQGRYQQALEFASQAHARQPRALAACMALARAQMEVGQYDEAVSTLEPARTMHPENTALLEMLARACGGANRLSEAEALIANLEERGRSQNSTALRLQLLMVRGQWAEAEKLLQTVLEENPDNLSAMLPMARVLANQGQWQKAEAFLETCLEQQPDSAELWLELGNIRLSNADDTRLNAASEAFSQALSKQKDDPRALRGLFEVSVRQENRGAALGLCNRYLEQSPHDAEMFEKKAMLLMQLPGRTQEAFKSVQQALAIQQSPLAYYLRGRLQLKREHFAEAVEDFQRFDRSGQTPPGNLDALMAEAYLGLGNKKLAQAYLDSARDSEAAITQEDNARLARVAAALEAKETP